MTVVVASGGYPESYGTGYEIEGVKDAESMDGVAVFHAGTGTQDGRLVSTGGRVLNVSALGPTIPAARERAYEAVGRITDEGHVRQNRHRERHRVSFVAILMGSESDRDVMKKADRRAGRVRRRVRDERDLRAPQAACARRVHRGGRVARRRGVHLRRRAWRPRFPVWSLRTRRGR